MSVTLCSCLRRCAIPEGPELLVSRDVLRQHLLGEKIVSYEIASTGRYGKTPMIGSGELDKTLAWEHELEIAAIDVKGKFMYWTLVVVDEPDNHVDSWIHCSYGMTGQWLIDSEAKHPVITFVMQSGKRVTFNDPRHFGTVKFVFDPTEHAKKIGTIGPDLFDVHMYDFTNRLRAHPKRTLPEVLMDQRVISGCGNYIKAESLYKAALSPHRTVESLSDDELENLFGHIRRTMFDSAVSGGATLSTYKNPLGEEGDFAFELLVYGKKKDPNGNDVVKEETLDGRTTWWVPEVQK